MAESAALVPVPFFPPVRTDTGAFYKYEDASTPPWPMQGGVKLDAAAPSRATGTAYARDGSLVFDGPVGTRVNIYV
ncbi:hypothetical protein DSCW_54080 [Desulfosarcina widdelii]|uniref:Uncharacterized protein n=1 Tax=Desulfosarcina widdelii TaxID=947919 RepID=A0A5K7ZE25_9BACT|nr:hypothetical protein DSCW_54080 [Desulfosarcina widdelii]